MQLSIEVNWSRDPSPSLTDTFKMPFFIHASLKPHLVRASTPFCNKDIPFKRKKKRMTQSESPPSLSWNSTLFDGTMLWLVSCSICGIPYCLWRWESMCALQALVDGNIWKLCEYLVACWFVFRKVLMTFRNWFLVQIARHSCWVCFTLEYIFCMFAAVLRGELRVDSTTLLSVEIQGKE